MTSSGSTIIDLSRSERITPFERDIVAEATKRVLDADGVGVYPSANRREHVENTLADRFAGPGRAAALVAGIDEAVDCVLWKHTALRPCVFTPTFSGFLERLRCMGRSWDEFDLGLDYRLDTRTVNRVDKEHLVLLANPANPTGTCASHDTLHRLADRAGALLVDEAYVEFAENTTRYESIAPANTFTYLSFSKAYCLAGMRCGALFGPPDQIQTIRASCRRFDSTSSIALESVALALESDVPSLCVREVRRSRAAFHDLLAEHHINFRPTQTNFVLLKLGGNGDEVRSRLVDQRIVVRSLTDVGLHDWVRMTVPSADKAQHVVDALKKVKQCR